MSRDNQYPIWTLQTESGKVCYEARTASDAIAMANMDGFIVTDILGQDTRCPDVLTFVIWGGMR